MAENLEQLLLSNGMGYLNSKNLAEGFSKKNDDYKLIEQYALGVFGQKYRLSEDAAKQAAEDMKKMAPAQLKAQMDALTGAYASDLAGVVSAHYSTLVQNGDSDLLVQMALGASGKLKQIEAIQDALKAGKLDAVRKVYADTFEDKAWKMYITSGASEGFIQKYSQDYAMGQMNDFLKNFSVEKIVEGQTQMTPDAKKLSDYLLAQESEAKDDKVKFALYLEVGKSYVQYKLMKQQMEEAQKEAKKKQEAAEKEGKEPAKAKPKSGKEEKKGK